MLSHPVGRYVARQLDRMAELIATNKTPDLLHPFRLSRFFENDLVGEKGGGSDLFQKREIQRIADFLEVDCNDQKSIEIQKVLFGNQKSIKER